MIPDVDRNDTLEAVAQRDEGAVRSLYRSYAGVMRALARNVGSWGWQSGSDGAGDDSGSDDIGRDDIGSNYRGSDDGGHESSRDSRRDDHRHAGREYHRHAGRYGAGDVAARESNLAEEAVQDVFVSFWEAAPSFDRSKADPDTWLATLGHRLLIQRSRELRHLLRQRAAATGLLSSASESGITGTGIPAAGIPEAGVPEAGITESKVPESGIPEGGVSEGGIPEAGILEARILRALRSGSRVHTRLAGLDDESRYLLTHAFFCGATVEELAKLSDRTPRQVTLALIRAVEWLRRSGAVTAEDAHTPPGEQSYLDSGPVPAAEPVGIESSVEAPIDDTALVDYAFGTVARERTAEIEGFLDDHPAVANRVRLFQDALAGLVLALEDLPSASDGQNHTSEDELVARLRAHRRPPLPPRASNQGYVRRNQAWVGLGMAAALGLTVWLALGPLRTDGVERRIERYQARPGTLSTQLQDPDGDELGTLLRLRNGRLFVAFEERPAGAATYQVWELRGERIRSLGTPEGRTLLTAPVAAGAIVAITLEPSGGSSEPTGELLVELRL